MTVQVLHGDCLEVLRGLDDCSVDAIVTDPPYGLSNTKPAQVADVLKAWVTGDTATVPAGKGFMGQSWDGFVPPPAVWEECMRVLKPGGHMAVFAGARTQDLMGLSIRLAGFEIRDTPGWVYGSGFPKSMDIGKAIDKQRNDKRETLAVTSRLSELASAAGISRKDVDSHMGTSDMGGWWLSTLPHRCVVPSVENWAKLRDFIPGAHELDAEVWRLNGRKGTPGEAWEKREVIGRSSSGIGTAFGDGQWAQGKAEEFDLTAPAPDAAKQWDGWGTALKPAIEPVLLAQKPFNVVPLYEVANKTHHILGALKWLSLSPAKRAEITSTSNHQEQHEEMCASVLANVETEQSPEKYDATDTFRSPEMALTYLNTEKLWQNILGAISDPTITFTTSTESSTITVLKTLNSLLGQITSATTMPPCECLLNGQRSNVISAESNSSESWSNWKATLNVSVPESVIEQTAKTALSLLANIAENLSQPGTAAGGGSVLSHAQIGLVTQSGESQNDHANGAGSLTSLAGIRGGSVQSAAQQSSSAIEPIILARKPLVGTVAGNVLAHGVGGLNIDACRVQTDDDTARTCNGVGSSSSFDMAASGERRVNGGSPAGRFPANVLLDEHAAQEMDKQSGVSVSVAGGKSGTHFSAGNEGVPTPDRPRGGHNDSGGASRFFPVFKYQAKAPKRERPVIYKNNCECEEWQSQQKDTTGSTVTEERSWNTSTSGNSTTEKCQQDTTYTTSTTTSSTTGLRTSNASAGSTIRESTQDAKSEMANGGNRAESVESSNQSEQSTGISAKRGGHSTDDAGHAISEKWYTTSNCEKCGEPRLKVQHATVKPLALMEWLVTLITPPGGVVLDPFAGSGTTLQAALNKGFQPIGIEQDADYIKLINKRLEVTSSTLNS